jgi:hypothetical protein
MRLKVLHTFGSLLACPHSDRRHSPFCRMRTGGDPRHSGSSVFDIFDTRRDSETGVESPWVEAVNLACWTGASVRLKCQKSAPSSKPPKQRN